jgi:hypothetical protein
VRGERSLGRCGAAPTSARVPAPAPAAAAAAVVVGPVRRVVAYFTTLGGFLFLRLRRAQFSGKAGVVKAG